MDSHIHATLSRCLDSLFEDTAKPLVIALAELTFKQWPDILRILKVCTKLL